MTHFKPGAEHPRWKGGVTTDAATGYRIVTSGKRRYEHIAVVERALGHALPEGAVVHHVNEDTSDNSNGNLVACQDRAYHALLHLRQRALDACGNPAFRKCVKCKGWDDTAYMMPHTAKQDGWRHRGGRSTCAQRAAVVA